MTKQQPSRVLLLCVYGTLLNQLDNDTIYNTFIPIAQPKKVLIFEKGEVTKAFVEFYSKQAADKIKNGLDGKKMLQGQGKMHIYFSNLREVDLKNQFSKGKDYSTNSSSVLSSKSNENLEEDFSNVTIKDCDQLKRYKTVEQPRSLTKYIDEMDKDDQLSERIKSEILTNILNDDTPIKQNRTEQISHHWLIPPKQTLPFTLYQTVYTMNEYISNILRFHYDIQITIKQVYNLFSNYGNIEKIVKKNKNVVIKFQTCEFAVLARDYLNNTVLYGNIMNLQYTDEKQMTQRPRQYMESVVFDESYFRFTLKKSISINPPSNILHISNMKKQTCSQSKLINLFSEYGNVEKVSILSHGKDRNMALVKMNKIEQGFSAIASLHNYEVQGRKLQISFTKSKI